jgi:DNA-binding beta-propeller fold protein YncE
MTEARVPCVACKAPILTGARKCRDCKAWQVDVSPIRDGSDPGRVTDAGAPRPGPRMPRAALIVATAVSTVMAVIISGRESLVGEAPPLTPLVPDPSGVAAAPAPAAIGPEAEPEPERPEAVARTYRTREIPIGDGHPLDIVFHPKGQSVYVSVDDATLREYRLKNGELLHKATLPAQGDQIRLLFNRYVAVLRHTDAARIPVMDTTAWDRDPVLLEVGRGPGDIVELPDGRSVVAATTDGKRVSRFDLPTGTRLANITLPHATGQLFLVSAEGRPYVAAMGALSHIGRPAGAWIDLFDPNEASFGATRRSISVGRDPREGAVTADGTAIFFPDRLSNTAVLLRVAATTEAKVVAVGQSPELAFLMAEDRYGVTLNGAARSASVVDLSTMKVEATLMLEGTPRAGVTSRDRQTLFIALGGREWPPRGKGVAVLAGAPPKLIASLPTGDGACAVAVSSDGARAAVTNYFDRSITIIE